MTSSYSSRFIQQQRKTYSPRLKKKRSLNSKREIHGNLPYGRVCSEWVIPHEKDMGTQKAARIRSRNQDYPQHRRFVRETLVSLLFSLSTARTLFIVKSHGHTSWWVQRDTAIFSCPLQSRAHNLTHKPSSDLALKSVLRDLIRRGQLQLGGVVSLIVHHHIQRWSVMHVATLFQQFEHKSVLGHTKTTNSADVFLTC